MTASSMPLFGARRPTLTQRAPEVAAGAAAAGCRPRGHDGGGWHDGGAAEAGLAQLRLVEGRHGQAERGARRQLAQLRLGQELVTCQAVVPWGVVLGRRDVVVVHDQGFGPGAEPGTEGRGRGELVDQHVPGFGLFGVAGEGTGLGRRLGVVPLHVDVRGDAARHHDVAQAQRVPPDRVGAVQHRDELVHASHGVAGAGAASGTSRSTKRSAADGRSSTASRCRPAAISAFRRGVSRSRAAMAAASA